MKPSFRQKFRYWFDNLMSRGTPAMIGMLFALSLAIVFIAGALLALTGFAPEDGDGHANDVTRIAQRAVGVMDENRLIEKRCGTDFTERIIRDDDRISDLVELCIALVLDERRLDAGLRSCAVSWQSGLTGKTTKARLRLGQIVRASDGLWCHQPRKESRHGYHAGCIAWNQAVLEGGEL